VTRWTRCAKYLGQMSFRSKVVVQTHRQTDKLNCVNGSAPIYLQICNPVKADVHLPWLRSTDHGDLVVPRANTDRFGRRGFLCPGRTSGTSCHLTFGRYPINQNNLLVHWKSFYFQTALTSTSAENIKRRAIAKTSTSTTSTSTSQVNPMSFTSC